MRQPSLHAAAAGHDAPRPTRSATIAAATDCGEAVRALPCGATRVHRAPTENRRMYMHFSLGPLVSLIAGILILVMPRLLNYIVAIYLILIGIIGLLAAHGGTAI